MIDQDKCIKCGTCLEVCPPRFGAVSVPANATHVAAPFFLTDDQVVSIVDLQETKSYHLTDHPPWSFRFRMSARIR